MSSQEWGFNVRRVDVEYDWRAPDGSTRDRPVERRIEPPRWKVYLPHQCDDWAIVDTWLPPDADRDDWGAYMTGAPQADAVAALERFIAEAEAALVALKSGQEYGAKESAR